MRKLILIAGPLALVACQNQPAAENATASGPVANASVEAVPPSETAVVETEAGRAVVTPGGTPNAIPAALQGRWGLVPGDCTSTRGDAKGLIEVTADTLTFYESRARLEEPVKVTATSVTGEFAFTGEGQAWRKAVTLSRDGETLVREEADLPQPLRYQRCPQAAVR